jgi:hypothetical protein
MDREVERLRRFARRFVSVIAPVRGELGKLGAFGNNLEVLDKQARDILDGVLLSRGNHYTLAQGRKKSAATRKKRAEEYYKRVGHIISERRAENASWELIIESLKHAEIKPPKGEWNAVKVKYFLRMYEQSKE